MKNQLSAPCLTRALPVPLASAHVSYVQWTVFGEQALPVRSEVAADETMKALALSRVIWLTASATPELGTSTIRSTLSTSYHCRAMAEPTSALFWWSAATTSTFMPLAAAPKSSTAIRAATTEPGPARSAYSPDWSFSTPILMMPSEIWANAVPASEASSAANTISVFLIIVLLLLCSEGDGSGRRDYTPR